MDRDDDEDGKIEDELARLKAQLASLERSVQVTGHGTSGNRTREFITDERIARNGLSGPSSNGGNDSLSTRSSGSEPTPMTYETNTLRLEIGSLANENFYSEGMRGYKPANTAYRLENVHLTPTVAGYNPVASPLDTMSFHKGIRSIFPGGPLKYKSFGPLTWIVLMNADPSLRMLWDHIYELKHSKGGNFESAFTPNGAASEPSKSAAEDTIALPVNYSSNFRGVGASTGPAETDEEIVKQIIAILPPRAVVWQLYRRFFQVLYPQIYFVDEVDFTDRISRLIGYGNTSEERVTEISLLQEFDLTYLGLLLVVLRFGYLSLFTNTGALNECYMSAPGGQSLIVHPLTLDLMRLASKCLAKHSLVRDASLPLIQLVLAIKLYRIYAPEEGDADDGADGHLFFSILLQMAYSYGLNRDPSFFELGAIVDRKTERTHNMQRKLWHVIMIIDSKNSVATGVGHSIDLALSDVSIPMYVPGHGHDYPGDDPIEKNMNCTFASFLAMEEPLRGITALVLRVNGAVNIAELCSKLAAFETLCNENLGSASNVMSQINLLGQAYDRAIKLKLFFSLNVFAVLIYMHIFRHYEQQRNHLLAFFYMRKCLLTTIEDVMPCLDTLIENSHIIFKESTDIITTPGLQLVIHKSLLVIAAVLVRIKFAMVKREKEVYLRSEFSSSTNGAPYESLKRTFDLIYESHKIFIEACAKIGNRYYYAWKVYRAQKFMFSVLVGDGMYDAKCASHEGIVFSQDMLDTLCDIFQTAIEKIKGNKRQKRRKQSDTSSGNSNTSISSFGKTPLGIFGIANGFGPNSRDTPNVQLPDLSSLGAPDLGGLESDLGLDMAAFEELMTSYI